MNKLPDSNPKTAQGAKKLPLHLVPPSARAALAIAFKEGAEKYGPYNWREDGISISTYYAACGRHMDAFWDGEDLAPDSKIKHLYHAMACIAIMIDADSIGKLNDDRPPKGAMEKFLTEYTEEARNSKE